jgi:threonine aldolase
MADRTIDLRSDAVTHPTDPMYQAIRDAPLGDDAIGTSGDPMVKRLEEMAAELTGKQAALFLPSGTMANLVALLVHTNPGDGVVVEASSHIMTDEVAAVCAIAGVVPRPIETSDGRITAESIAAVTPARVTLVCLENTHNRHGGTILTAEATRAVAELAHGSGFKVHLDGARVFNAAVALGVNVRDLTQPADSVMFCLTKGLCCPVGSLLAGSSDFISEARRTRKLLGGAMHQAGLLAACGVVALQAGFEHIIVDHENAKLLADGVAGLSGVSLATPPSTNIVLLQLDSGRISNHDFVRCLDEHRIASLPFPSNRVRLVTHHDISRSDVLETIRCIKQLMTSGA